MIYKYIIIWFVFILIFSMFFFFKREQRKIKWNDLSSFIQTIASISAILFVGYSIEQNNEVSNLTLNQIKKQDSISNETIRELKSISGSSFKLRENMDTISFRLLMFPAQVDSITTSFQELNRVIKQQQQLTLNELSKKPDIHFRIFDCKILENGKQLDYSYEYKNIGTLDARIDNITFKCKSGIYSNYMNYCNEHGFRTYTDDFSKYYISSIDYNNLIILPKTSKRGECGFDISHVNINEEKIEVDYIVYYESKNYSQYQIHGKFIICK
jgi:hypothetical protein